jgi:general secretion pathway protein M
VTRVLPDWVAQLRSRWQGSSAREQRGITMAVAALAAYVLWAFALAPALRTWRAAPVEIEALERQLQSMQQLAAQARQMQALPPMPAAQATAVLRSAAARLGASAKLTMQADRAVLILQSASGEQIVAFLAEARSGARARAVEAKLAREPGGGYSGSLILVLGSGA